MRIEKKQKMRNLLDLTTLVGLLLYEPRYTLKLRITKGNCNIFYIFYIFYQRCF